MTCSSGSIRHLSYSVLPRRNGATLLTGLHVSVNDADAEAWACVSAMRIRASAWQRTFNARLSVTVPVAVRLGTSSARQRSATMSATHNASVGDFGFRFRFRSFSDDGNTQNSVSISAHSLHPNSPHCCACSMSSPLDPFISSPPV